jgi:ABC-type sulfate transport system substrate-binding protein
MERATRREVGASFLERNVTVDQINNVDAVQQFLNKGLGDHGCFWENNIGLNKEKSDAVFSSVKWPSPLTASPLLTA